jgi:predicted phage baseplate assembly protein
MALKVPNLDDRHFKDIVEEAIRRIPQYCKNWTDHNESDPGITLIELFAWMTDMLLYRLNQVPDLHYIKYLEMLGIKLGEPVAARAPMTFWLSQPQPNPVIIPAGTMVSSTQTETEPSITFMTDQDFCVQPPELHSVLKRVSSGSSGKRTLEEINLRRLEAGLEPGVEMFSPVPQVDDAFYFGFDNDLSDHLLGFEVSCDPAGGANVDPSQPPYLWEASTGNDTAPWEICLVDQDTSKALNSGGRIRIHLPKMGRREYIRQQLFWVRVRIKEITLAERSQGMQPYTKTPRLLRCSTGSWGGTIPATHAMRVSREFLGRSDGSPGQRFHLQSTPVLRRRPGECLTVQVEGRPPEAWQEVPDFASSDSEDSHYTLDPLSGEIRLAPAVRQPDGTIRLYGRVPPQAANLIFETYRCGGGQNGNVQAGIINTLKTDIPYVSQVSNREPAWGGLDAESLEAAMMRAPAMLRSRERAVSESDYEFLASQAFPAVIGRVRCLQPRPTDAARVIPGQVYLLVIPRLPHPEGRLTRAQLVPHDEDIAALAAYMDERRLLTTRLEISQPAYQWVAVKVKLRAAPGVSAIRVEQQVFDRLYAYLNPLTGGPGKDGWPFGRDLFVSDVYQCLQGLPDVLFIRSVEMYSVQPEGEPAGSPVEQIEVLDHGVVVSGKHLVEFV